MVRLVAHADWGADSRKQWVAVARSDARGRWTAHPPVRVGDEGSLRRRLHLADPAQPAFVGFDFPLGLPRDYAARVGIERFPPFLEECARGEWSSFLHVADSPDEIGLRRPFYPRTYLPRGAKRRDHLTSALGLEYASLLRRCERATPARVAACSLFWTCGGNQVGKGAIAGWRLLQREAPGSLLLWPFDGPLESLLRTGRTVVAETYPGDVVHQLGLGLVRGKRRQERRRAMATGLIGAATALGIELDPMLEDEIRGGFGSSPSGEDRFDAVVGLVGMLAVVLGARPPGEPRDDHAVTTVEGWVLGQAAGGDGGDGGDGGVGGDDGHGEIRQTRPRHPAPIVGDGGTS